MAADGGDRRGGRGIKAPAQTAPVAPKTAEGVEVKLPNIAMGLMVQGQTHHASQNAGGQFGGACGESPIGKSLYRDIPLGQSLYGFPIRGIPIWGHSYIG